MADKPQPKRLQLNVTPEQLGEILLALHVKRFHGIPNEHLLSAHEMLQERWDRYIADNPEILKEKQ